MAASPAQSAWIHELGHSIALCFVLPVGGLTATMNFMTQRKPHMSIFGFIGLSMIYAANGGHDMFLLNKLPHDLAHALHCGTVLHRAVNVCGCALLLGSNYVLHRTSCTNPDHNHSNGKHVHGPDCNH
mmetsp:Transcript_10419/g.15259  ORF Transcript_10419/g.15259 Transcript_10419/m.15259 type:complete len:128 (+) Transcript_10419:534-917(+)